jgi:hypothetical protein
MSIVPFWPRISRNASAIREQKECHHTALTRAKGQYKICFDSAASRLILFHQLQELGTAVTMTQSTSLALVVAIALTATASTVNAITSTKPLYEIGGGAYLRGPITLRDGKGRTFFYLPAGVWLGTPPKAQCDPQ